MYRRADVEAFQTAMSTVESNLTDMSDIDDMWNLFSEGIRDAVDKYVPTKTIKDKPANQPVWFSKESSSIVRKQRKTYNMYKTTGDPFFLDRYRALRKESKKKLRSMKREYIEHKVCQPLKSGNSKPFYRHIKHETVIQ